MIETKGKEYWEGYREIGEDVIGFDEVSDVVEYLNHERGEWNEECEDSSVVDNNSFIRVVIEVLEMMKEDNTIGLTENEVFAMFCQIC